MLERLGSERNRRTTLRALKLVGVVLAVSTLIVAVIAWSGFLIWLGVQGAKALAHLF